MTRAVAQPEDGQVSSGVPAFRTLVEAVEGTTLRYEIEKSSVVDHNGLREDPTLFAALEIEVLRVVGDERIVRWQIYESKPGEPERPSGPPSVLRFDASWQPIGVENPEQVRGFNRAIFLRSGQARMASDPEFGQEELDNQMRVWEAGMDDPAEVLALAGAQPARFFFGLGWDLPQGEERSWESLDAGPFGLAIEVQNRVRLLSEGEPDERVGGLILEWTMTQDAEELGRQMIAQMRAADLAAGRGEGAYPDPSEFTLSQTVLTYRADPVTGWLDEVRVTHQGQVGPRLQTGVTVYRRAE